MGFTKWTARKAQALSVGARKAKEQQVVPSNQQEAAGTASPAPKAAPAVPDERGPWRQRKGRGAAPVRGADSTAGAGCDDQQCVEEPSAVEFVAEDVQAEAHTPRSSAPPAPPSSSPAARALAVLGSTVSAAAGAAVDAISVDVLALPGEVAADVGVAAVLAAGVASAALGPVAAAVAAPVAAAAAALGLAGRVALRRSERKRKQPEAVEEAHARPQPPQQSSPPPDVAALAASWESEDMLWEEGSTVPARAPGQFSDTAQRTPQAACVIVTLGGSPAAVAYTFEPGESEDPASLGQHRSLLVDVSPLCDQLSLAVPWRWRDRDGVVKVNFQEVLPLFAVLALHWDCSNFAPYLCVEKITLDALKAIQSEAYEMVRRHPCQGSQRDLELLHKKTSEHAQRYNLRLEFSKIRQCFLLSVLDIMNRKAVTSAFGIASTDNRSRATPDDAKELASVCSAISELISTAVGSTSELQYGPSSNSAKVTYVVKDGLPGMSPQQLRPSGEGIFPQFCSKLRSAREQMLAARHADVQLGRPPVEGVAEVEQQSRKGRKGRRAVAAAAEDSEQQQADEEVEWVEQSPEWFQRRTEVALAAISASEGKQIARRAKGVRVRKTLQVQRTSQSSIHAMLRRRRRRKAATNQ
ncbi:hypothetical protein N2152v2_002305 [Parachlorella kessleri]